MFRARYSTEVMHIAIVRKKMHHEVDSELDIGKLKTWRLKKKATFPN